VDIEFIKEKFTMSKKRIGMGHIIARLDWFLVQSDLLVSILSFSSKINP
jgi:hypothetical protein